MRRVGSPTAIAVGGGALVALSMPPWGWWPLAFVGIALFDRASRATASRRRRAALGMAFALPWFLAAMAWMWYLTAPGYLIASVLFAGFHGVAAAVSPTGRWAVIGRPAAHTIAEATRMIFPFGGVPLATLAISQAGGPLLGVARVGGVLALTWIVFQVGCSTPTLARRDPRTTPIAAVGLCVAVAVAGLSLVAPSGHDTGATVTVAGVQGGGEQGTSALDVRSDVVTERLLEATETIAPGDADVVVWPENGVDVNATPFTDDEAFADVAAQAARLDAPLLIGVTEDSEFSSHPSPGRFVNAHVVVTPDGDIASRYEKVHRVPFGEYVPMRATLEALGAPLDQIPSDAAAGRDPAQLTLPDGTNVGVMISWEVFFGDRGRAANSADAAWLINPTNGASYTGTILQTQQVASSRLRAVENGRWVVQVSPTGFSAFIDPSGHVFDRTGTRERAVIVRDIALRTGTTWYRTLGDRPFQLLAIATVVAAILAERRDRTRHRSPESES